MSGVGLIRSLQRGGGSALRAKFAAKQSKGSMVSAGEGLRRKLLWIEGGVVVKVWPHMSYNLSAHSTSLQVRITLYRTKTFPHIYSDSLHYL